MRDKHLQTRIREHYAELPDSERRVADTILDFPGEIAAYSATELAALAGTSKAAVTRLVRRLAFESFEEARRSARDTKSWGSPVYLLSRSRHREAFSKRIERHIHQDVTNITRSFEGLLEREVDEIVEGLLKARRVWLLGYRNSYFLAGYAKSLLIQVRGGVHLLPSPGVTLAEHFSEMRRDDFLFVIGFRRRVPEVRRALALGRELAMKSLLIADPAAREAGAATWTLRCECRGDDPFDRYAAAISLLHFLSVVAIRKAGTAGRNRLKRVEEFHEHLHDFD